MRKLTLDLDALQVDSFAADDGGADARGTVEAHNHTFLHCPVVRTELDGCVLNTLEFQNTCQQTCLRTCDYSCLDTCGGTCLHTCNPTCTWGCNP